MESERFYFKDRGKLRVRITKRIGNHPAEVICVIKPVR